MKMNSLLFTRLSFAAAAVLSATAFMAYAPATRAGNPAAHSAPAFTAFDLPGASSTFPMDINADGDTVGQFVAGGLTHGFLRSAEGDFTTIDYPGAPFTALFGINSEGDIVGSFALVSVPGPLTERHGFLLSHGEFTPFDPEGSRFTTPLGINARGDIVGRYCIVQPCGRPGSGNWHGFLWRDGVSTTIDVPGSRETNAWKINADGEITGAFRTDGGPNRLFTLRGAEFTTFDLPDLLPVAQDDGGANARGDIVGTYCDISPCGLTNTATHGFVLRQGVLTTIDYPGATKTIVFSMNSHGDVTGASGGHGFILSRED